MKLNLLLPLCLLFFSFNGLSGQYLPLAEEGNFWIYLNHVNYDFPAPISGHAITLLGDTTINNQQYKKVYKLNLSGSHDCPPASQPCWQFDIPYQTTSKELIAFIREDITNKKVYNLPLSGSGFCAATEHLLLDYSLTVGDTINNCIYTFIGAGDPLQTNWGIVDSLKTVNRFGQDRLILFTTGIQLYLGLPPVGKVLILEGIGLQNYGLYYEPMSILADFCEGSFGPCNLILSNKPAPQTPRIEVFPNPSSGIVYVTSTAAPLEKITVYSALGTPLISASNTNQIDLSKLGKGIYLLEFFTKNKERYVRRIVKSG